MLQSVNLEGRDNLKILKSLLICLPAILLGLLFTFFGKNVNDELALYAKGSATLFLVALFFLIIHTGKTYYYRRIFFVTVAVSLPIGFITHLLATRGSMAINLAQIIECKAPFCHLVIPMLVIPWAFAKTIIFPGSLDPYSFANIPQMIILWLCATLAMGRGWCGWVCFYGGWDELFSSLAKSPKIPSIPEKWRYLPYAVLTTVVLVSAATLSPTYCEWLCPFKTVTEFVAVVSWVGVLKTAIFLSLFFGLVIIFPLLTKKRTQCSFLCPFGVVQSASNSLNVTSIRIDTDVCVKCGLCKKVCPLFAINEESLAEGKTLINCAKCGACVDACPKNAIRYYIAGTGKGSNPEVSRILAIYPPFIFALAIGGGIIGNGLYVILKFISTGSVL
ncbi:MAG: 4Fe-4S binding protein [Candidatus Riflebacteria bacterium]|nr:4Fe-4S binding protein [Candidatus Riflebacteria bacterium]